MTRLNYQTSALRLLVIAAVAASIASMTGATYAAPKKGAQAEAASALPKKSRSVKVKHQQNHSGETTAERDRRLYRECKGRPNAGACLGYAHR